MKNTLLSLCTVLFGLFGLVTLPQTAAGQDVWRLGYVNSDALDAGSFPFAYYTHVVVLGVECNGNGTLFNRWGYNPANWAAYRSGATAQGVKLMLFVGGDMTSCTNSANLSSFTNKVANTVKGLDTSLNTAGVAFDGLTLDWEGGLNDSKTGQYENLISALRGALGSSKVISVDGWAASFFRTVIVNQQSNLDRFNNEMYDSAVNGAGDNSLRGWSWYNMANKSMDSFDSGSAESGANYYISAGFPADKINEGIPFYGYLYSGCNHSEVVGCSASGPQYTYRSIHNNSAWWNSPHSYDSRNQANYISFSNQYLTYTDTSQIADLTSWGKSVSLGGYFTWEVDFETLAGGTLAQNFPLSYALYTDTASDTGSYTPPSITTTSPLAAGTVGTPYSLHVNSSGSAPMTWAVGSGALPNGISLNSSSGLLSGTPSTVGSSSFTIEASNAAGNNSRQFSLTVNAKLSTSWFNLTSINSGKCLDVTGMSNTANVQLQQWTCESGAANQQFQLTSVQGGYKITAKNSGLQLNVRGGTTATQDGAAIIQWPYSGASNEIWNLEPNVDGSYLIKALNSGKCIDVAGISQSDGALIQQWTCWGGANQKWNMIPVQ